MTAPTYHDIREEDMPLVEENGSTVRVVAGRYENIVGPQGQFVQPTVLDARLKPEAAFSIPVPDYETLFIYVLEGSGDFGTPSQTVEQRTAVVFGDGDLLNAKAGLNGMRFALFAGKPLHEPIAWGGPIVMNTEEELETAFHELRNGTFIKNK